MYLKPIGPPPLTVKCKGKLETNATGFICWFILTCKTKLFPLSPLITCFKKHIKSQNPLKISV